MNASIQSKPPSPKCMVTSLNRINDVNESIERSFGLEQQEARVLGSELPEKSLILTEILDDLKYIHKFIKAYKLKKLENEKRETKTDEN